MCGIFFSAHHRHDGSHSDNGLVDISEKLRAANAARGPDSQGSHEIHVTFNRSTANQEKSILDLQFYTAELWLRGETLVTQPHYDENEGNILCWNGEIFDGMNVRIYIFLQPPFTFSKTEIYLQVPANDNDGVRMFHKLRSLDTAEQIRDLLGTIEGPYALVYFQARIKRLIFARDPLGRRSLLIHKPTPSQPYLLLASVSAGVDPRYSFEELCTKNIFTLELSLINGNLQKEFDSCLMCLTRDPLDNDAPFAQPVRINDSLPLSEDIPSVESLAQVPGHLVNAVDEFIMHLDRSVMLRVKDIPQHSVEGKARLAVLFSGGIDSTIITLLAHRHVPLDEPIDLLNVSFENPRKIRMQTEGNPGGVPKRQKKKISSKDLKTKSTESTAYDVPDRRTGLEGLLELWRLCPGRVWNFVEVNVPYEESLAARQVVESLMTPVRTVMDLSLALALYFASRGVGQLGGLPTTTPIPYISSARVLLNGLGSDELLGGYGRHRSAYDVGGWQAVVKELQLELDRIPVRNLGRDDRVISSHGKETRHPFLSLSVVNFLAGLPVHHKVDPRLSVGVGDKMLLRLAAWKLGLHEASRRKKRAMQFGSHSARMDGERRGDTPLE